MNPAKTWPECVILGQPSTVDESVVLGYPPGRRIEQTRLDIGPNAAIRAGTIIYAGSTIGADLETGHNVVIREQNTIGDEFRVWNGTTIDYGCTIGNRVKVHTNCYVAQFTVLEDDVFLAPGVSIANDKYPGQVSPPKLDGPIIRRGAQLGVNVTVLPGVEIGRDTLVGSGSVVTRNLPAGVVAIGNPARVVSTVKELRRAQGMED